MIMEYSHYTAITVSFVFKKNTIITVIALVFSCSDALAKPHMRLIFKPCGKSNKRKKTKNSNNKKTPFIKCIRTKKGNTKI